MAGYSGSISVECRGVYSAQTNGAEAQWIRKVTYSKGVIADCPFSLERHVEKQHQNISCPSLTYGWEAATYCRGRHRKAHSSRGWQATEVRAAAAADATIRPSEVPRGPSRSSPAAWCAGRSSGACGEGPGGGGARSWSTAHLGEGGCYRCGPPRSRWA